MNRPLCFDRPDRVFSRRRLRLEQEIRHILSCALGRGTVRDPVLDDVSITITQVRSGSDLRNATVLFVPLGGEGDAAAMREALLRLRGVLRRHLAQRLNMKYTPQLWFEVDRRFDDAVRMEALMSSPEVRRDLDADTHSYNQEDLEPHGA